MPKGYSRASSHSTRASISTKISSRLATPQPSDANSDSSYHTSPYYSTSSMPISVNRAATPSSSSNLEDQLAHSPNTRFHAVWMLLRYFYLCRKMDDGKRSENPRLSRTSSVDSVRSTAADTQGLNLVLWDVTVACLSLSVKVRLFRLFKLNTSLSLLNPLH